MTHQQRLMSVRARLRELRRLAGRARCSLDEAARRRNEGERYCEPHGWRRTAKCRRCRSRRRGSHVL